MFLDTSQHNNIRAGVGVGVGNNITGGTDTDYDHGSL